MKLLLAREHPKTINIPEFLSAHRLTEQRIQGIYGSAAQHYGAFNKTTVSLPIVYQRKMDDNYIDEAFRPRTSKAGILIFSNTNTTQATCEGEATDH